METSKSTLDTELATNLKQAKSRTADNPSFFALVLKGSAAGKLMVDKRKIAPKQIADAKKESGGSALVQGLCYGGEGGATIFETSKAVAPALAALVKRLAREAAGVSITAEFILGREDVQLPDEAEQRTAETEETDKAAATAWQTRLNEVTARVKTAAAAKHPAARALITGLSEAQALFRDGDSARADAKLSQVEALLDAKTAPPTAPAPTKDAVVQRLNALSEAIKTALTGPNGTKVKTLFVGVNGLIKKSDFTQAGKVLDELESVLKPPAAPPAPPKAAPAGDAVMKRFNALAGPIKTAMGAKGPNVSQIQSLMVAVNAALKNKDFTQANKILDQLEPLIATAPVKETAPTKETAPGKEGAALLTALDGFRDASDTVDAQISKLQSALRTTKDEDLIAIAEYGVNGITGNHKVRLMALAMELRRATGTDLKALAAKALPIVAGFRAHLTGNEEVDVCDSNPFGVTVTIKATLGGALERLEAALKTAA